MPGLPLAVHESSHSRSVDQMCHLDSRARISPQATVAAEGSLSIYCKPVELYNILQRRALHNPPFMQRCLNYNIEAKRKRRIHITMSLSGIDKNGEQTRKLLPIYMLLVKPVTDIHSKEQSAVYKVLRACVLTGLAEDGRKDMKEASFIIPELKKLCAAREANNVSIFLLSRGQRCNSSGEPEDLMSVDSISLKLAGPCLCGRMPLETLHSSWKKSASFTLGNRSQEWVVVDMKLSLVKAGVLDEDNYIQFQKSHSSGTMGSRRMHVNVSAQEIRGKERSSYITHNEFPASSLSHILRLRTGNVIFNYRYHNNSLQKTEVTEEFSCPFCLVGCGSFKGLRCHLTCSHNLFNFEFWVTEEYQAVNVSIKTELWRPEIVADGTDPRLQTFSYNSKPRKRKRINDLDVNQKRASRHITRLSSPEEVTGGAPSKDVGSNYLHIPTLSTADIDPRNGEMALPLPFGRSKSDNCVLRGIEPVASCSNANGACAAAALGTARVDSGHLASERRLWSCSKTKKLSVDRADQGGRALLRKRQFFHSHRAQPMAIEEVHSERDSEDEVDDDIADLEDRRMLDDFVDVTKDEKQIMHLWNSFVRKQKVLADGHIPWACEAFSKLHGRLLIQMPALLWCWRLFMIKLWNHSLLDVRTINNCNLTLESYQKESSSPKQS